MKKVLALSAAALLMTGVYAAESNVQVYGVIDAAVTGYKVKGQDAMLEFTSGFSMGNRIGIRGRCGIRCRIGSRCAFRLRAVGCAFSDAGGIFAVRAAR